MRRHGLVWAMLVAVVATASSDAESDYWKKWRSERGEGDEESGGPWDFTDYVKIEPVGPALTGQPVEVRTRAVFRQQPGCYPPARVKARVFWELGVGTELLSDPMVETYVGPRDTLDVRAVIRGNGGITACAHVYLYYVVGGVPVKGVLPVGVRDPAAWDHWAYAVWGCGHFGPNPLNPRELLDRDQLDLIRRDTAQAFKDRLAGARVGVVAASAEAQAVLDSLLPMVDEPTRRQLGVACDYLGGETKTPPRDAARFVGKQVRVWAKGKEYGMGTPQKAAEWTIELAENGMLLDLYRTQREFATNPVGQIYDAMRAAIAGKITWDEAEARVDSLIAAYPDDPNVVRQGPFIRERQLPEWRAQYERPWWRKWLDGLRGEASATEAPSDGERYAWSFHGYWKYRDHAVTRYDGLSPEATEQPLRRAWAFVTFQSAWGQ